MGQLLVPAMIGAGVGAAGGIATGKNPFKAALLGGALGAGGAGLMGAGAAGGAGATAGTLGQGAGSGLIGGANLTGAGVASGAGAGATGGLGNFLSSIRGIETTPVSMGTGGYASGIGGQAIGGTPAILGPGQSLDEILGYTIPKQNLADVTSPEAIANSAFPRFEQSGFRNLGAGPTESSLMSNSVSAPFSTEAFTNNPLMSQQIANNAGQTASTSFLDTLGLSNLSTMDKIGLGKMGLDAGFANQAEQMIRPELRQIKQGNPEAASSPLYNVGPNVNMQQGNEIGMPNLKTTMPLTEDELLKLQQALQTTGYRGR
jgi:hypothetical protein